MTLVFQSCIIIDIIMLPPNLVLQILCQILGFLLAGVVLNQLGLIRSVTDIKALSELGILFLVSFSEVQTYARYSLKLIF